MGDTKKTYYITTPIYYPSAKLHIGHTYCTSVADTIARFKRLAGYDVRFLTGSDEHGQKIQRAAAAEGITPLEYTTNIVNGFKALWEKMHISNDDFIRTTDERHEKVVQELFTKAYEKGDIYKAEYEGWYCTPDETFWTEQKLGPNHTCPDCGRPVERVKEESYFFKLGKYTDQWLKFIEENPDFIQPESRRNEMIQFVKQGLEDLAVSRTSFDWGIKVPFDPKHVVYVWFDALVNYISALSPFDGDGELYKKYWPADLHLVGKEIVRFHTIIWPMMLMSLELPLPKKVFGHGWMIVDGTKMSKSLGNVIDPIPLIDTYGADSLRYYLLSEITLGNDGNFTLPNFVTKINADLSNDLGNLLNRTIAMIEKYHDGVITKCDDMDDLDRDVSALAVQTVKDFEASMENMELNKAIKTVWAFIGRMNKYIDETMPWALAKDEEKKARLETVLYNLIESITIGASLLEPFMPETSKKILEQLNTQARAFDDMTEFGKYPSGNKVTEKPEILFARLDIKDVMPKVEEIQAKQKAETAPEEKYPEVEPKEEITIDDFDKVQIRVGEVLKCEPVPKAKKLLVSQIRIGNEVRQIVSGIAKYYKPEEMVGKKVAVITNLKPCKLCGVESQGMILAAADDDGNLSVMTLDKDMPAGSEIC